jgi:hypothetical protein
MGAPGHSLTVGLGTRCLGMGSSSSEKGGCGNGQPLSWHSPASQRLQQHTHVIFLIKKTINYVKFLKVHKKQRKSLCLF